MIGVEVPDTKVEVPVIVRGRPVGKVNVLLTLKVDHREGLVILDTGGPVPADVEGTVEGIETEL